MSTSQKPDGPAELKPLPEISVGRWRHYKGNFYWVLVVARHSETLEPLVVYRPITVNESTEEFWVRPFSMWHESVDVGNSAQVPRFVWVGN